MATRTGIDTNLSNRLGADHQQLFIAVEAKFDTETIRVWNGLEDISFGGVTYIGAGTLLSISTIEESTDISSQGISITLSGMDSSVLNLALTENYQNRSIEVFMGYLSGGTNNIAGSFTMFKGRMTAMTINDTTQGATISLQAENRLIDLERPSHFRYTKESQEFLPTGDTFFNRVASLQDKEIVWGRPSTASSSGGGGGGGSRNGFDHGVGINERF